MVSVNRGVNSSKQARLRVKKFSRVAFKKFKTSKTKRGLLQKSTRNQPWFKTSKTKSGDGQVQTGLPRRSKQARLRVIFDDPVISMVTVQNKQD